MENIKKFTLPNGIHVLYEHIPYIRSLLLGLWVSRGSRHENKQEQGLAHYLEHMLFKGSSRRDSRQIAESLEFVGGELNGFTSRENCCYYAKATDDHCELIFDVISDLVLHPRLDSDDVEKERGVIFQEIDMYEDSPEELAHELILKELYGHALGHPVIGNKESVGGFQAEQIRDFHSTFYHPENIFITLVGNTEGFDVENLAYQYFNTPKKSSPVGKGQKAREKKNKGIRATYKGIEQSHLVIGWSAMPIDHPKRYVMHLISAYLGGGMSSLLFQDLREDKGLTYNVYSFLRAYRDSGFLGVYSAHHTQSSAEVISGIRTNIDRLCQEKIPQKRLDQLRSQLKGSLLLGLEKTAFRMNRMGVGHLYFGRVIGPDELIEMIQEVTPEEIQQLSQHIFENRPACVNVGQLEQSEFEALLQGHFL